MKVKCKKCGTMEEVIHTCNNCKTKYAIPTQEKAPTITTTTLTCPKCKIQNQTVLCPECNAEINLKKNKIKTKTKTVKNGQCTNCGVMHPPPKVVGHRGDGSPIVRKDICGICGGQIYQGEEKIPKKILDEVIKKQTEGKIPFIIKRDDTFVVQARTIPRKK